MGHDSWCTGWRSWAKLENVRRLMYNMFFFYPLCSMYIHLHVADVYGNRMSIAQVGCQKPWVHQLQIIFCHKLAQQTTMFCLRSAKATTVDEFKKFKRVGKNLPRTFNVFNLPKSVLKSVERPRLMFLAFIFVHSASKEDLNQFFWKGHRMKRIHHFCNKTT